MTASTTRRKSASSPPAGGRPQSAHRKPQAKLKGEARQPSESGPVDALPVQHPHAAGIDIGSRSHWVALKLRLHLTTADRLPTSPKGVPHG